MSPHGPGRMTGLVTALLEAFGLSPDISRFYDRRERTFAQRLETPLCPAARWLARTDDVTVRKTMRLPGNTMRFPAVTAKTRLVLIVALSVAVLRGGTLAAVATTGGAAAGAAARANAQAAQSPAPYIFVHDPT